METKMITPEDIIKMASKYNPKEDVMNVNLIVDASDEKLTRMNRDFQMANILATPEARKIIKRFQRLIHIEMYERGFDVRKPKNYFS